MCTADACSDSALDDAILTQLTGRHLLSKAGLDRQLSTCGQGMIMMQCMQGMDAYEFAEPVDVTKHLDKAFWEGLGAAKWQERRDALQRLKSVTGNPKLAAGDFGDVVRELKKIVAKDSNVVCVG